MAVRGQAFDFLHGNGNNTPNCRRIVEAVRYVVGQQNKLLFWTVERWLLDY